MDLIDEAIIFATNAHSGQKRKIYGTPYILHPLEVASIIATMTTSQEVMAAGVLHDVVEDRQIDPELILDEFGERVYELVLSETEDIDRDKPKKDTWMERKAESIERLKQYEDIDVKRIWLADKLSNVRSIYQTYKREGNGVWSHFHQQDIKMQRWYYYSILDSLKDLSNTIAYDEYQRLINIIFEGVNNG